MQFHLLINALINLIRSTENKIFNIHDQVGIKLLTRLRLGFSHFRELKFWLSFEDTINPPCSCRIEPQMISTFFCTVSLGKAYEWFNARSYFPSENYEKFLDMLIYGNKILQYKNNQNCLRSILNFIIDLYRFDNSLF